MKLFTAVLLACVLPAFGQGVPVQLASQFHETCVAHAEETLHGRWHLAPEMSFDIPKFCACADSEIQRDAYFGRLARRPESDRGPSSWAAHTMADLYLLDGIDCYSKTVGWPPGVSPGLPGRSLEEVRVVLELRKGALYAAYNQALKRNPKLAGKVVLEFTVEASGAVENLSVRSSQLTDEAFLDAIKSIAGKMQFPLEPVEKLVTTYPLDFLPN
jgi:TonB family protein